MTVSSCFSFSTRLAGVALAMMLLPGACGKDATNDAEAAQQTVDPNLMVAQPTLVQRLRVVLMGKQPIAEHLRVPEQTAFDKQRVARAGATITGRVTELVATPGQDVKAGDIPARLHSMELGAVQLAYQKAAVQRDLQVHVLRHAKLLLAANAIGPTELQKRQSRLATADAEVRAVVDQLCVMGVSPGTLAKMRTSGMPLISSVMTSIGGTVVERKVARGQAVQPADELFTVADLSRVWVVGEVLEDVAAGVRAGQVVGIDTDAGDRTVGKLIWVSDTIDSQMRMVMVRTEVDSAERMLKPSTLTTLFIQLRPEERVVVPTFAVVRKDNRGYVFVCTNGTNYQPMPVGLGDESSGMRPIISGVQAGQPIVVEGGFHLNDERKRIEMEGV